MAKSRSAPTGDNFQWTCLVEGCGATESGFPDIDSAAASASEHATEVHPEASVTPKFSYENLNPPPEPPVVVPPDLQALWNAVPAAKNLQKADLDPFIKAAFNLN